MTILDRLLGHDAWTTRQLLLRCRELSDEQLDRVFDIGDRSLRGTIIHVVECIEIHSDRMLGRSDRNLKEDYSIGALLERLATASKELAEFATRVEREDRADSTYMGGGGNTRSLGAGIAHVITHSMHHRAQMMYMLEQLGVKDVIEGDVIGWESVARGWGWADGGSQGHPVVE